MRKLITISLVFMVAFGFIIVGNAEAGKLKKSVLRTMPTQAQSTLPPEGTWVGVYEWIAWGCDGIPYHTVFAEGEFPFKAPEAYLYDSLNGSSGKDTLREITPQFDTGYDLEKGLGSFRSSCKVPQPGEHVFELELQAEDGNDYHFYTSAYVPPFDFSLWEVEKKAKGYLLSLQVAACGTGMPATLTTVNIGNIFTAKDVPLIVTEWGTPLYQFSVPVAKMKQIIKNQKKYDGIWTEIQIDDDYYGFDTWYYLP